MSFTTAEKVDIRRHCGYPQFGAVPSSFQSYRFFQAYGTLEYRMQNMLAEEEAVIRTVYLANLNALEAAIVGAGDNLDTEKAAVWTRNKNEVRDRSALYAQWSARLCRQIGIPLGPDYSGAGNGCVELMV